MFGMGGMNPKQMEKMMKQLGMDVVTIDADEVVIKSGSQRIIISNPSVQKIKVQGKETFQISGDVSEQAEEKEKFSEADVKMVAEQAKCPETKARKALEENNGDIAEAILSLQN